MIVVAGPPGSGKSSIFPVAQTGVDHFNIDDRAAQLNGGSYRNIPPEIRAQSNRECELFIEAHIRGQKSFAVETTLRTRKTLQQARLARKNGFGLEMILSRSTVSKTTLNGLRCGPMPEVTRPLRVAFEPLTGRAWRIFRMRCGSLIAYECMTTLGLETRGWRWKRKGRSFVPSPNTRQAG
jgi:hypothetical protein